MHVHSRQIHRLLMPLAVVIVIFLSRITFAEDTPATFTLTEEPSSFTISRIDWGDLAWGQNVLRVEVTNTTDRERPFWLHIGGRYRYSGRGLGFGKGMRKPIRLGPNERRTIEHEYFIPPQVGKILCEVCMVEPSGTAPPWDQEPFWEKARYITFRCGNKKCNELTPFSWSIEGNPALKQYAQGAKILPLEPFSSDHFVFYASPGTPGHRDVKNLIATRETTLRRVYEFFGMDLPDKLAAKKKTNVFLFPDAPSKLHCTLHRGDGLAFGNTLVEIYDGTVRVDPAHEVTHVVASQIGNPPAMLNEGLAVYMQEGHQWLGEHVDTTAAKLLRKDKLVPITRLIKRNEIGSKKNDGKIAYPESASFVKYLIDRYGKEKFLELYAKLRVGSKDNPSRFKEVMGIDLVSAQQDWIIVLGHVAL